MAAGDFAYFEKMVLKPTWKEVLIELISSNKIDPWDIDITALADAFLHKVREIKKMDFALEANLILASSILLKYKSEYLKFLNYQANLDQYLDNASEENLRIPLDSIPELSFTSRVPPKRQITLEDLLAEMEKAIKYESNDRQKVIKGAITETIDIELPQRDLENDMKEVFESIKNNIDQSGWALFSNITKKSNNVVYLLLCLLYLFQEEKIDLRQDEIFGEVLIKIKN